MSFPHLEFTQVHSSAEVTGTGDIIWDPPDGKHFVITEVTFTATGNCTFTLFAENDGTDADRVFKGEILADTPTTLTFENGWVGPEQNDRLRGTESASETVYVQVVGYEF